MTRRNFTALHCGACRARTDFSRTVTDAHRRMYPALQLQLQLPVRLRLRLRLRHRGLESASGCCGPPGGVNQR
ncbi:hypothetical protein [Streptomyces hiroshimensis]